LSNSQKEETLEKLQVEITEHKSRFESFDKTFNSEKGSEKTEVLQNTLNEFKSKLEQLEVCWKFNVFT
jgi:hypothetical protein